MIGFAQIHLKFTFDGGVVIIIGLILQNHVGEYFIRLRFYHAQGSLKDHFCSCWLETVNMGAR